MELGRRIKQLRLSKHLTQEQLVNGFFDRSYLSQIENGKITPPLTTIKLLAERLSVPVNAIMPDEYNYLGLSQSCDLLLNMARTTHDEEITKDAWKVSRKLNSLEKMCEVILVWYKASNHPTSDFQQALFETVNLGASQDMFSDEYWQVMLCVGNTYFRYGMYQQAVSEYRRLIGMFPPQAIRFRTLVNLGSALLELKNFGEAHLAFTEAINQAQSQDTNLGRSYQGLGISSRNLGHLSEAMFHTKKAAELFHKNNDMVRFNNARVNTAVLLLDEFHIQEAQSMLVECYTFCETQNDSIGLSKICEEFARLNFYQHNYELSLDWSDRGIHFLSEDQNTAGRLFAWKTYSYLKMNQQQAAMDCILSIKALFGAKFEETIQLVDPNISPDFKLQLKKVIDLKRLKQVNLVQ
ncbi:helix-turn-helix domain-containing protein [Alicyclobacillus fodiniaquatilis]|uniref:Helix-turn-helix domain-containing protein n=1 Tax=Alicyclobacillus fodiniaquatilis TaxID=1661150 RepID=A0ABW4JI73_9BACL